MHPRLSDPLTWQEICRRYPDQWVALVDIDWIDDTDDFASARVADMDRLALIPCSTRGS